MCAYFHHHLSGRPTDRRTGIKTWISSNKELFSSAFCPAFWYWTKYPWSPCILYNWWLLLGCICGGWMACWGTSLVYLVFVVSYCLVLPGLRLYYKSQTEIAFSFLQVITSETKKKKKTLHLIYHLAISFLKRTFTSPVDWFLSLRVYCTSPNPSFEIIYFLHF